MNKWIPFLLVLTLGSAQSTGRQTVPELLALADSLSAAAKHDSAIAVEQKALEIAEREYGAVDSTVARILMAMGIEYYSKAQYAECEKHWTRALDIYNSAFGPDHPKAAACLSNLGMLYNTQGKYEEAERALKKSLTIYESSDGSDPSRISNCVNNLAALYWGQGKYGLAEESFGRALAIRKEALGPDHPDVAACLNNLGGVCLDKGEFVEAERWFEQALEVYEKAVGTDHPSVALVLNNLANVYADLNRFDEAEKMYRRAIAIRENLLGENHPDVAVSQNGLASIYLAHGLNDKAEPLLEKVLANLESRLGPEHPAIAYPLSNLGIVYNRQAKYEKAETSFQRALAIREKELGPVHPSVAGTLQNLVVLRWNQRKYGEARAYNNRAVAIRKEILSPTHPLVAESISNSAVLYRYEGNIDSAMALSRRACEIWRTNLVNIGRGLSERDALDYSTNMRDAMSRYLSCYFEDYSEEPEVRIELAETVLKSKGQVSDEIFERQRTVISEDDPAMQEIAGALQRYKQQLSQIFVQGPGPDVGAYRARVDSLSQKINSSEVALARQSASFRNWRESKNVSIGRVKQQLPDDACVVEYLRYDHAQIDPDRVMPAYAAVLISSDDAPFIVDLGEASGIENLVGEYRRHLRQSSLFGAPTEADLAEYVAISGELYEKIWLPVANLVGDKKLIFICPDAALNLVSFAGLTGPEDRYLVEDYAVHYLSSGRDLIRLAQTSPPAAGLLAMGDPDYDLAPSGTRVAPGEQTAAVAASGDRPVTRGLPDCEEFWKTVVSPLPGTRREIEAVASSWSRVESEPALVFLGEEAAEEAFRTNAQGKRVVHLATHGYYMGGTCRQDASAPERQIESPLLLSGFFLAGANKRGERPADAGATGDGVLTASEISGMNLNGCELVVLSACETGLGVPEEGEGVYGLRRAFQLAGARTVVSALWEVSDEDTARFISRLISRLYVKTGGQIPFRFRQLQLERIEELRERGLPDHPLGWAAFVAQGDWRN